MKKLVDEPKDNNCVMTFSCPSPYSESPNTGAECVYFRDNNDSGMCDFAELYDERLCYCRSVVACANKMTLKLKKMGLK